MVGREPELDTLLGHLLTQDLPAAALIVGEPGIGKTVLSLAVAEIAAARGHLVLACHASETDAGFSFAGLGDLVRPVLSDVLPELPPPQRRALEAALALSEVGATPVEEGVVAFAFLNLLRGRAARRPVLLVVDDLQWLDIPSLAILRFALSRLETESVAALLAVREGAPTWLRRALPDERLLTLQLGPLSVGATREVLRARSGVDLSRPALLRIWETAGGNPFFAIELAEALRQRGGRVAPGEELAIPSNLDDLVRDRLDRIGARGLVVSRVIAALANPTPALVEAAAPEVAEDGLSAAMTAGILEVEGDRLRFAHPLLRSAVWSGASPLERRTLHARLAAVVPDAEERARHLALAITGPSAEVAATVEAASQDVHARGAAASAAELAELAVRLTPPTDVDDMRRRVLDCADRFREAGDGMRALALLETAGREASPGRARAAVLLRMARTEVDLVAPRTAVEHLRQALIEARGDPALEAEIHLDLAGLVKISEDRNLGLAHAEQAVEAAAEAGDIALRCRALATYGLMHCRIGRGVPRQAMEEALALERSLAQPPLDGGTAWSLAYQLLWTGELDRARELLEGLRRELSARDAVEQAQATWFLALVEWRAGNWERAAAYAADTLAERAQFGLSGPNPQAELPAALIAAHRGQLKEAIDIAEGALGVAEAEGVRVAQSGHHWVLGFIELSRGDPIKALEHLERAWEIRDLVLLLEPGHRLELADTLEALIATGRLDAAEAKLVPWEERAAALDRSWALAITARCRALLSAARGDAAGAEAAFARSLAEHARTLDPFQHARTLLALGMAQRRSKQRGAARKTLEAALAIFEAVGAPLWVEKARQELARISGRTSSGNELTEGERRVAALAAEGRTNREVAAALFLTPHSVETVLSRVYLKLGVRSRTELARLLAASPEEASRSNS